MQSCISQCVLSRLASTESNMPRLQGSQLIHILSFKKIEIIDSKLLLLLISNLFTQLFLQLNKFSIITISGVILLSKTYNIPYLLVIFLKVVIITNDENEDSYLLPVVYMQRSDLLLLYRWGSINHLTYGCDEQRHGREH